MMICNGLLEEDCKNYQVPVNVNYFGEIDIIGRIWEYDDIAITYWDEQGYKLKMPRRGILSFRVEPVLAL